MGCYVGDWARRCLLAVFCAFAWQQTASAQQLVLLDKTVMPRSGLPASEFGDSHYYIYAKDFAKPAPPSLRMPVNYAEGSVHIRLEVLKKPSAAETYFNICFDNGGATCTGYLEKYTKPGVYEYNKPLSGQYNYASFDFNKALTRLALVIKTGAEQKPQVGDANFGDYYPTELRVTMTLVPKGATFVPPGAMADAGMPEPPDPAPTGTTGGQIVLADGRVSATAANTMKSEYTYQPASNLPANLKSPIDYSAGKIHARLEVFSKPGNAPTFLTACIESAGPKNTCTGYIRDMTYTTTGVYDHEQTVASMWNSANYDWSAKISRVYFVLKDGMDGLVQGNADFYPTDVRLTVTLIPPGETYVPPGTGPMPDAGTMMPPAAAGSGGSKAPQAGAAGMAPTSAAGTNATAPRAGTGGTGSPSGAGQPAKAGASASAGTTAAGSGGGLATPEPTPDIDVYPSGSSSCTVADGPKPASDPLWLLGAAAAIGLAWTRRRTPRR